MYYLLNLWFKTFGFNKTASMTLCLDDKEQVMIFINGYKPLIKEYNLYKVETNIDGNTTIAKRTKIG